MNRLMSLIVVAWFAVAVASWIWPIPVEVQMYLMGAGTVASLALIGPLPRGWWKPGIWDRPNATRL